MRVGSLPSSKLTNEGWRKSIGQSVAKKLHDAAMKADKEKIEMKHPHFPKGWNGSTMKGARTDPQRIFRN